MKFHHRAHKVLHRGYCEKTIEEERGILLPLLMKGIIGSYVYDHLTRSGAQSLWCLLPIFDPVWSVKILWIFSDEYLCQPKEVYSKD